ncbi:MAG: hypothetical protein QM713_04590 [Arachnia sp.]
MNEAAAAIARIVGAAGPADVFDGNPTQADAARRAKRRYRQLVALIHPDVAAGFGVSAAEAAQATARLNQLFDAWMNDGAQTGQTPHVVGTRGTYRLCRLVRRGARLGIYATDHPGVTVAISRRPDDATTALLRAAQNLSDAGLGAFAPAVVDRGAVAGRAWVASRLLGGPLGGSFSFTSARKAPTEAAELRSLRQVRAAYPAGLDGRDWAWMARRILMALDAAGVQHGAIGLDTVLIHPDHHGVVLDGWGESDQPDGPAVSALFDELLAPSETRQRRFATGSAALAPGRRLREYDLLLGALYGPRRFRRFELP